MSVEIVEVSSSEITVTVTANDEYTITVEPISSGGGGSDAYTPDDENDWPVVPTTKDQALDLLAARLKTIEDFIDQNNFLKV